MAELNKLQTEVQKRYFKFMLMKSCKMINELKNTEEGLKAIDIIKTNPICNKRVIERYSKVIKDPDPLASTMVNISQRTPIICRTNWLKSLPRDINEWLAGGSLKSDKRFSGWSYCRKEAVDYWIANHDIEEEDENQERMINLLYCTPRNAVRYFYDVRWSEHKFRFGQTELKREKIATQIQHFDIPSAYRKLALAEFLSPGIYLHKNPEVLRYAETLKEKAGDYVMEGMALKNQARILMNHMDPRMRTLPVMSLHTKASTDGPHAFFSRHWVIDAELTPDEDEIKNTDWIRNMCDWVFYSIRYVQLKEERLSAIESVRDNGKTLREILTSVPFYDNFSTQAIKSVLGIPITNESIQSGITFYCSAASIRTQTVTNASKEVYWEEYLDEEKVEFKTRENVCGFFRHLKDRISYMRLKKTDKSTFLLILAAIANYVRWNWKITGGKTKSDLKRKTRDIINKSPEEFLGLDESDMSKFLTELNRGTSEYTVETRHMTLVIANEYELAEPIKQVYEVSKEWHLYTNASGGLIRIAKPYMQRPQLECMPITVTSDNMYIIPCLSIRESFKQTLKHHSKRSDLIKNIRERNFTNFNEHCSDWVKNGEMPHIAHTAMNLCNLAAKDTENYPQLYIAFLYMFTNCTLLSTVGRTEFKLKNADLVNFACKTGIFRYDEDLRKFKLHGQIIETETFSLNEDDLSLLITKQYIGYRFEITSNRALHDLNTVVKKLHTMADGTMLPARTGGVNVLVTRDRTIGVKINKTLKRHIDEIDRERAMSRSRKMEQMYIKSKEEEIESKRARKE